MLPVLVVGLLSAICAGLAALLLVIPGIVLACMLYVAVPAAVVEKPGITGALSRSRELTKDNRGAIFGILLVIGLLNFVVSKVLQSVFLGDDATPADVKAYLWVMVGISVLFASLGAVINGVVYHDLRQAKDGVARSRTWPACSSKGREWEVDRFSGRAARMARSGENRRGTYSRRTGLEHRKRSRDAASRDGSAARTTDLSIRGPQVTSWASTCPPAACRGASSAPGGRAGRRDSPRNRSGSGGRRRVPPANVRADLLAYDVQGQGGGRAAGCVAGVAKHSLQHLQLVDAVDSQLLAREGEAGLVPTRALGRRPADIGQEPRPGRARPACRRPGRRRAAGRG